MTTRSSHRTRSSEPLARDRQSATVVEPPFTAQEFLSWVGDMMLRPGVPPMDPEHARREDVNLDKRFIFIVEPLGGKVKRPRRSQPIPLTAWRFSSSVVK